MSLVATALLATTLATLPGPNPHNVSVAATEFAFELSQPSVKAGDVRVELDNTRAEDPHALTLRRGGRRIVFAEQAPGTVTARTVSLSPGRYRLVCPLAKHVKLGMKATLRVR